MQHKITLSLLLGTVLVGGIVSGGHLINKSVNTYYFPEGKAPVQALGKRNVPKPEDQKIFNAQTFELDNGMQVVLIENHKIPVVTHMVWYKVGASDEPWGKSGIAHFFEHLMFKGTEKVAPGDFSKTVRNLGGNDNAFTSQDYTAYFQSVPSKHLGTVMEMEADRMNNLSVPEEEFLSERDVILEERNQRTDTNPTAKFMERIKASLFANHPYGIPVIGWRHEIAALDYETAMDFYDKWYAPNNAILVVSGNVTLEELKTLAQQTYGLLPAEDVPQRQWTQAPDLPGAGTYVMHDPQVKQPMWIRAYQAPSIKESYEDTLALEVLEELLSGGSSARLYQSLVVEQKLATSVNMSYSGTLLLDGTVIFHAIPREGVTMEQISTAIDVELLKLIREGIDAKELSETKEKMINSSIYARDSIAGPAMIFGGSIASGLSVDQIEYWPRDIRAVTDEKIVELITGWLNPNDPENNPSITGHLLPPKVEELNGVVEKEEASHEGE